MKIIQFILEFETSVSFFMHTTADELSTQSESTQLLG